ncbi:alpha-methylacyl-CoA racemase [Fusarium austroafricanum]|uniref:Alpha-methylacyl-CoA racemase n=1 Tax=Fusarium austroafricanum TaxID=2364996 RepID=A0A8H4NS13_9HYPO|nr:alpha-methylacyl-CoA racemase [Fusarium austroafricanum]
MPHPPPLTGIKVLEFAGLAPGPYAGMLLADAGASVLRIDRARPGASAPTEDMLARHKSSISVDIKSENGVELVKCLASQADILIDPFRPGVLEKLSLGPDELCRLNPKLIYGRMTGFRRDGKYALMAGHDINYLAVSGTLGMLGRDGEKPHPPWNILADFAGGGAILFEGILMAIISRQSSGRGQVVEANMVDGSSYLTTFPRMALNTPMGNKSRGNNLLDGGAPFYDTYEVSDGKYIAVGALEPQFFAALLKGLGLAGQGWEEDQHDTTRWPELRKLMTEKFRSKTRAEWEAIFDGTDACCTPVLEYSELQTDPKREGDQRPAVTLRETPCLAVKEGVSNIDPARFGQGPGVSGNGYKASLLKPGAGGEDALRKWMGWENGREYALHQGGLVLREISKL